VLTKRLPLRNAERLLRIVVFSVFALLAVQLRSHFVYPRAVGVLISSESNSDVLQEAVHPLVHVERTFRCATHARVSRKNHQSLTGEVDHIDIVINKKRAHLLVLGEAPNQTRRQSALLYIEMCARLIEHEKISIAAQARCDGYSLQFTAAQIVKRAL